MTKNQEAVTLFPTTPHPRKIKANKKNQKDVNCHVTLKCTIQQEQCWDNLPLSTHPYQIDEFRPTCTSPMTEAP